MPPVLAALERAGTYSDMISIFMLHEVYASESRVTFLNKFTRAHFAVNGSKWFRFCFSVSIWYFWCVELAMASTCASHRT